MALSIGLVGLPNVGKTTLFNALTHGHADASNYPFCTVDQNVGEVAVPDPRLERLNEILQPQECTPAHINFIDVAGLVRGASQGEGLGNQFLSYIRAVDAIAHVVRCFADDRVVHVEGSVDPARDAEVVDLELIVADLESTERVITRRHKQLKGMRSSEDAELTTLEKVCEALQEGLSIRSMALTQEEQTVLRGLGLLTLKPMLYVANVSEQDIGRTTPVLKALQDYAENAPVLVISAAIEQELTELAPPEQAFFLEEMGLHEPGLQRLIRAGYDRLNLITFYTIVNEKLRAWPILRGTKAPQAAGKIHTDMARGFIRAEVVNFTDLATFGTMAELQQRGLVRIEGKEYEIQDGDVLHILFRAPYA